MKTVASYDVVTFDIFDTLLMRKIMSPFDVFRIVEDRIARFSVEDARKYKQSRQTAIPENEEPSYLGIYEAMRQQNGWSQEQTEFIRNLEIETEKELLISRDAVVDVLKVAQEHSEVYLVSDMHFSAEIINRFLEKNKIFIPIERIIVSSDMGMNKSSGELWEWVSENVICGRKALHIGDNKKADYDMPIKYGVDAFKIMNAFDMLMHSSLREISSKVVSVNASLQLGLICSRIFNNPFALNNSKGILNFYKDKDAGYSVFGPLSCNYIYWIKNKSIVDGVQQLVFLARDGYLLQKVYKHAGKIDADGMWPESVYVDMSRRVIWGTNAIDEEGVLFAAKDDYRGNAKDFLKDRYGIVLKDADLGNIDITELKKNDKDYKAFMRTFSAEIMENAKKERINYLNYLDGFKLQKEMAVVDIGFYGTIQYLLQKLLGYKFPGYYMCAYLDSSNEYLKQNQMYACFQDKDDLSAQNSAVIEYLDFLESYFTSPEGMAVCVGDDGKTVYSSPKSNQKYFTIREEMNEGVCEFVSEYVEMCKNLDRKDDLLDVIFADDLYRAFMDKGFVPSQKMKDSFFYDNAISFKTENKIWD